MNVKLLFLLLLLPICIHAECTCEESSNSNDHNKTEALKFKLLAIASIFVAGAVGVCIPQFGKMFKSFSTESDIFLAIKFFAAGVILATGFVHVFPDANESLESPCLVDKAWGDFPLGNFVAMLAAVVVMMVETTVTRVFNNKMVEVVAGDEEKQDSQVHVHTHTSHGHAHGSSETLLRHQIISVVLEIGIIVHSVIIGIALGVSLHPKTIKPLIAALSFHQMFEGMGLGSCITEAKFEVWTVAKMLVAFSLTTPVGIAIGIGIANTYDENSHTALIVQGLLNAASAGILVYMALVDLLAMDFMKAKVQKSIRIQTLAFVSILLGLGCMSLLAIWA